MSNSTELRISLVQKKLNIYLVKGRKITIDKMTYPLQETMKASFQHETKGRGDNMRTVVRLL